MKRAPVHRWTGAPSVFRSWWRGVPPPAGPLRGCHLHRTGTKAVQWITSFVGRATALRAPTLRLADPPKTVEPPHGANRATESVRQPGGSATPFSVTDRDPAAGSRLYSYPANANDPGGSR